ncbi:MAG: DNA primase [Eubacteriales bacterium]
MPPIPPQFIDEVVARTNIVELVGEYVELNLKGGNHWGLCPFHLEKTPSFSVSSAKGIYKCFGCGKGGGAINFVMEQENLPFVDAVEHLARRANMTMPERTAVDLGAKKQRDRILELNKIAARFFHQTLYSEQGGVALSYLQGRDLSQSILTKFGLGFAPDAWDGLLLHMTEQKVTKQELLEAGLATSNDKGRIYDRFRNRIIFPIIDVRGDVVGFGGRVLDDSLPKYLNSPDTPVFNKSRTVFGLNLARKSKAGYAILTEGYMDTIALHQAGFDAGVASLGTSLTPDHARLLHRYFTQSILAYDGDSAGISATQRAIPILEKAGLTVQVLQMKDAKDPDEFIKKYGKGPFLRLLEQSENQVDYRMAQITKKFDLEDAHQKVSYLQEISQFLATLDSPIEREVYLGKVCTLAKVSPEALGQEVSKALQIQKNKAHLQEVRTNRNPVSALQPQARALHYANVKAALAEEGLVCVILADPAQIPKLSTLTASHFTSPLLGRVFELIRQRHTEGHTISLSHLAGELSPDEMNHMTRVIQTPLNLDNTEKSLSDYYNIIREEQEKATHPPSLLEIQQKNKEKKAFQTPLEESHERK